MFLRLLQLMSRAKVQSP
ncbi:hypothetical protein Gogos_011594 [Gossypium gossypioides]|uniref:Uncharacterized protein n=1 Tax=Gossypium gossypioides TaxID=34282 RepID=A0A7J9BPS7_GOSGO|nr:hypothetical protein [Gossypium gossypioides]